MQFVKSDPWINLTVQRVDMDEAYKTMNTVDRWGSVNVPVKSIALNVHQYQEPIPGLPLGSISVAGLAAAIASVSTKLIMTKFGGSLDEHGFIILE